MHLGIGAAYVSGDNIDFWGRSCGGAAAKRDEWVWRVFTRACVWGRGGRVGFQKYFAEVVFEMGANGE